jgi:S-adenosylmethionine hydrolase
MPRLITLLTDFGTADGYVGEMKGVLASLAPLTSVVDVAHDVAPHDIDGARLALARYWRRFPAGTVHLVVIDPGVGSARGALAATSEGRFLVGPDNGVLSPALLHADARCVSLAIPSGVAPTFHGRDVFAPAAALLASGQLAVDSLGPPATPLATNLVPQSRRHPDGADGEVVLVDRFGNLITNIEPPPGARLIAVRLGGIGLTPVATYADLAPAACGALVNSFGQLEIAQRNGSAASALAAGRGSAVIVTWTKMT